MSFNLSSRVAEIDHQVDRIQRLIAQASRTDPELAAGAATTEPLAVVQNEIDKAAAACEAIDQHMKDVARQEEEKPRSRLLSATK